MKWTEEQLAEYQAKRASTSRRSSAGESPTGVAVRQQRREKVIRQSGKQPNKTERRFLNEYLRPWLATGEIDEIGDHESITLRLANGLRYQPDFPTWKGDKLTFYEVKGDRVWEDSIKSLKVAANKYQRCRFFLCKYTKGGWIIQEVRA